MYCTALPRIALYWLLQGLTPGTLFMLIYHSNELEVTGHKQIKEGYGVLQGLQWGGWYP